MNRTKIAAVVQNYLKQHSAEYLGQTEEAEPATSLEVASTEGPSQHARLKYDDLSSDQKVVYDRVCRWFDDKSGPQTLSFGGYAGTGKTSLLSVLAGKMQNRVAFCALTGKAAGVLRNKLKAVDPYLLETHTVSTIHSLLYCPIVDELTGELKGFKRKNLRGVGQHENVKAKRAKSPCDSGGPEEAPVSLIIVDEASMVSEIIWADLCKDGIKVLAVGDHGQLPPIASSFNLMASPTLKLEKIHRQAEGNPIIKLASQVRTHGEIQKSWVEAAQSPHIRWVERSQLLPELERMYGKHKKPRELLDCCVLSYTNKARVWVNSKTRELRFGPDVGKVPCPEDILICLKNYSSGTVSDVKSKVKAANNKFIFNGLRGVVETVAKSDEKAIRLKVRFPEEDNYLEHCNICTYQLGHPSTISTLEEAASAGAKVESLKDLGRLYDYGYGLTVHKSQGSGFSDVLVILERAPWCSKADYGRWLYTAITRSSNNLTLLRP